LAKTAQQSDFQRSLFMPTHDHFQKTLHFPAMRQVADFDSVRPYLLPVLSQLPGIRFFVNPINRGNRPRSRFMGDEFIRQEHVFLDQLM
jgi:hypothetical protein